MSFISGSRPSAILAIILTVAFIMPVGPLSLTERHVPKGPWSAGWGAEAATSGFASNVRVDDSGNAVSEQSRPDMALTRGTNGLYVVWQDDRNGDFDIYLSKSTDGGITYGANVRVDDAPSSYNARYPSVAEAPNGDVFVVWDDDRGGDPDIRIARSTNGGSGFGASRAVDDAGSGHQDNAEVTVGLNGHVYVVWEDRRNGDDDIYFARSTDNGTSFGTNVKINDDAGTSVQNKPDIEVAKDGKLAVAWEDARQMGLNNFDIYSARSADGGGTWSTNVRVNDDSGDHAQRGAKVAADGGGTFYCAWYDYRNSNYDIYLANSTDGGASYGTNVQVDDGAVGTKQTDPAISAGRSGYVVVAWTDDRNGTEDIRLSPSKAYGGFFPISMRVDDSTNDSIEGNDNSHQNYPAVGVDHSGNIYTAWTDARRSDRDIWATVTSGGTPFNNAAPTLEDVLGSPMLGSTDTLFGFSVNYTDREGNPPAVGYPKVVIYTDLAMTEEAPESPKTLQEADPSDGDITDGKWYRNSLKLSKAGYNYTFLVVAKAAGGNRTLVGSSAVKGLVVDDSPVYFRDPSPVEGEWALSQYAVWCNVTAADAGGAGVDLSPNAVQYRTCSAGEADLSDWETFQYNSSKSRVWVTGGDVRLSQMVNFVGGEGTGNCIQWRARDTVGNGDQDGYTGSTFYEVSIDSFPPQYVDPYPAADSSGYEDDRSVQVAVTLEDNGTGVNMSSVRYRYSTTGASDEKFFDWTSPELEGSNMTARVEVGLKFQNGITNYVQWTVKDLAGHRSTSQKYQVKVDESINSPPSPPVAIFPNRTADRSPHISWEGSEDPEGDAISYELAIGTSGTKENILDWTSTQYNSYYDVGEELRPDIYYVKVRASDYVLTSEEFTSRMVITSSGNTGPGPPSDILPDLTTDTKPVLSWSPGSDKDGDELSYFVAIGTDWGSHDVLDWTRSFETSLEVPVHLDHGVYYVSVMTFDGSDYSRVITEELVVAFFATSVAWNDTSIRDSDAWQAAGTNDSYGLELMNLGNTVDNATVVLSGSLTGNATVYVDQRELLMDMSVAYPVRLWVDIPPTTQPGGYSVLVEVYSGNGIRTSSTYLNLEVSEAVDNGTDGNGGGVPGDGGGGGETPPPGATGGDDDSSGSFRETVEKFWWMFLIMAIMVGLVVTMVILTRRRRKEMAAVWEKRDGEGGEGEDGRPSRRAPRPPGPPGGPAREGGKPDFGGAVRGGPGPGPTLGPGGADEPAGLLGPGTGGVRGGEGRGPAGGKGWGPTGGEGRGPADRAGPDAPGGRGGAYRPGEPSPGDGATMDTDVY